MTDVLPDPMSEMEDPETIQNDVMPLALINTTINNTLPNQTHAAVVTALGDVIVNNTGAGAGLTIGVLGTASITDTLLGGNVTITNGAGAKLTLNGAISNGLLGNLTAGTVKITNDGETIIQPTLLSSLPLLGSLNTAIVNISAGDIILDNRNKMTITGAVANCASGNITVTNSAVANFDLTGDLINAGLGNITITNTAGGTVNIHGSVRNQSAGTVQLTNFTQIDGNVIGRNIQLSGGGKVLGYVAGNFLTAALTDTNTLVLDGITVGAVGTTTSLVAGVTSATAQLFGGNTSIIAKGNTVVNGTIYGAGGAAGVGVNGAVSLVLGGGTTAGQLTSVIGDLYGGGLQSVVNGAVTVSVLGTTTNLVKVTGNLFAGGKTGDVYGNTTLNIGGDPVTSWITGNVLGGGNGSNIGKLNAQVNTNININGGRIDGDIYMAGVRVGADTGNVYGNATVTFKGTGANLNFTHSVNGFGINGGVVAGNGTTGGKTTVKFDGFTGNFNATVNNVTEMQFTNGATVTVGSASQLNLINGFSFNYSTGGSTGSLIVTDNVNVAAINNVSVTIPASPASNQEYVLVKGSAALTSTFDGDQITIYASGSGTALGTIKVNDTTSFVTQGGYRFYAYTTIDGKLVVGADLATAVDLKWPTDFWQRSAPQRAVALASSGTVFLGDQANYQYTDSNGTNSTKAKITGAGTVYGGSENKNITGNTWLNVTGGAALTVYGGGSSRNTSGNANIYIQTESEGNTPRVINVYGGGKDTSSVANSFITIAGAAITGNVYGGGNGSGSTITGDSTITFTGAASGLTFTGMADGGGANGATVTGNRHLYFGDFDGKAPGTQRNFTGTYAGGFQNFTDVTVRAGSAVTLTSGKSYLANTWNINGSLTTAGATAGVYSASSLAVNVAAGGSVTDQLNSNINTAIVNQGTVNGAKFATGSVTLTNTGTAAGEYFARQFTLTNNAGGLLNNATLNSDVTGVTQLGITNASTQANKLTNTGLVSYTTAANWLTNTGTLTFANTGNMTISGSAATINNTGGNLTLDNSGTWNYTGLISGNSAATAGQMTIRNHNGTMTWTGVYNPTYDRNVLVLSQNPTAGSSLTITNGSTTEANGTMNLYGAVYALSSVNLAVTNYGTMNLGQTNTDAGQARAMLNSAGPGGVTVGNYKSLTVQGIRNEWQTIGSTSGTMQLNNNAGNFGIDGRLFDSNVVLPLAQADLTHVLGVLSGQLVGLTNIGGTLNAVNQAGATFDLRAAAMNAMGTGALNINNAGTMTLGAQYGSAGSYTYKDALYNYEASGGINVTNTGNLTLRGSVYNDGAGSIVINNNAAGAILEINKNSTGNYAVLNSDSGTITITNTAGTLNIRGDVVNKLSGTINISGYTLIDGNITGKNISLAGTGLVTGNISGGEIQAGETSTVSITGGTIGGAGKTVSGVTGTVVPGATVVTISGTTTVNSKVYGGGTNVKVNGQAQVTIGGAGSTVQLNESVYGGGLGSGDGTNAQVNSVLMTFNAGTTATQNIYGGGFNAKVGTGSGTAVSMTINGGSYAQVYAGGYNDGTGNADIVGDTNLVIKGGTQNRIFGGGYQASVQGSTHVTLGDGSATALTFNYGLFGGGYGNSNVTGTANFAINSNATVMKNIYGGGYALAGHSQSIGATKVTVTGGTVNGELYGGGLCVNGTINVTTAQVQVNAGSIFGNRLYGGGVAGGTGQMQVTTANTTINGGTFNLRVYGGGTATDTATSSVGTTNLTITGGTFNKDIITSGHAQGGTATTGNANLTISGGDFHGTIFGGGMGSNLEASKKATTNTVAITLDTTQNAINFHNGIVYCGGDLASTVSGNATLTIKGGVASNALNNLLQVSGDGWTAGSVKGNSALVFDGYKNNFGALITAFDTVKLNNNAQVVLNGAQNLTSVNDWQLAADNTPTTALLDWGNAVNSFVNDTMAVDVSGWTSAAVGATQTLMHGVAAAFSGWGQTMSVTIGGLSTVWDAGLNGWKSQNNAWAISVETVGGDSSNTILKLSKLA